MKMSSVCRRLVHDSNRSLSSLSSVFLKASSCCSFSSLLDEKDLDTFVDKFLQSSKDPTFRHKAYLYEIAVDRLASSGLHDSVVKIIESQKHFSNIRREGFAARLLRLYGRARLFDNARKLFDELPLLDCPRTSRSFNALLFAAVESKQHETAVKLFDELPPQIPVKPNIFSYNILIQAHCKMASLDSAYSVLKLMDEDGVEPNLITFNSLLSGFYGGNRFSDAEYIWGEMERAGCAPDIFSYNAKLRGLFLEGKVVEAVKLVGELKCRQGPKPDTFTFNVLIKGYCSEGNMGAAKEVFAEMAENGCAPNRWTYETLIPHLCENGEFEFAAKLCEECIDQSCAIDVSVLQNVVDALVKEWRIEDPKNIVEAAGVSKVRFCSELKLPEDNVVYVLMLRRLLLMY